MSQISPGNFIRRSKVERFIDSEARREAGADLVQTAASAQARDVDWECERERGRHVTFYQDGSMIQVGKADAWRRDGEPHVRGNRRAITIFSARSRSALLRTVAGVRRTLLPLFVTLTYPAAYSDDGRAWKRDLDTFAKWLVRRWPASGFLWKLEPQKRGAPHFHLLLWGVPWLPHNVLAKAWFDVVGSGDARHLAAGCSVERARSFRGAMNYAGKQYMGKQTDIPASWERMGRIWGVRGRAAMPWCSKLVMRVPNSVAVRFRRCVRRLADRRGWRRPGSGQLAIFTSDQAQWLRVLEWAHGEQLRPLRTGPHVGCAWCNEFSPRG